VIRFHVIF